MHASFLEAFPACFSLPTGFERNSMMQDTMHKVLRAAMDCLLRANPVSDAMSTFLADNVPKRTDIEVAQYESVWRSLTLKRPATRAASRRPKPQAGSSIIFQLKIEEW